MKWVTDTTRRFEWRPYYDQSEIDNECQRMVFDFLFIRHGLVTFPLSNDDLTVLIERDTSDLDLYADLTSAGADVEGQTAYFRNQKPSVKIARELSLDASRHEHLRTTLAHELGHVRFHSFLWRGDQAAPNAQTNVRKLNQKYRRYLQSRPSQETSQVTRLKTVASPNNSNAAARLGSYLLCISTNIIDSAEEDWMEWQAAYAGGAFLMPVSRLHDLVRRILPQGKSWTYAESPSGQDLINATAGIFEVPVQAASTRLLKLGCLQENPT